MAAKNSCCLVLAASTTNCIYTKTAKKDYLFLNSGSSLAIEKIVKFYSKLEIPVYTAIDNNENISKFEAFENCNFIKVPKTNSIFETLKFAIDELEKFNYKNIIINPIQVVPSEKLNKNSISLSSLLYRKGNWTAVQIKAEKIEFLFRDDKSKEGELAYAFTGRINFDIAHLKKFFNTCKDLEGKDLGYLACYLSNNFNYKFNYESWLDITHDILFAEAKLRNINCRNFHQIKYCQKTNSITKFHLNKEEYFNNIIYYKSLSGNIRRFFPTLIKDNEIEASQSYSLEYIPFPTLSELFLHERLEHHIWERIIQQLKFIYDEIYIYPKKANKFCCIDFFSCKLDERKSLLVQLMEDKKYSMLKNIFYKPYKVNSIQMDPLEKTFRNLSNSLKKFDSNMEVFFGHGDLCFNNILVDPYSLTIKLIDPKAYSGFGNEKIGFVPKNYDLAKLNHSFLGLYDSIIAKMYYLNKIEKNNFKLVIYQPNKYTFIKETFENIFLGNNQTLKHEINLITSSLFLSMLPLHSEDPKRMLVLAIIGNLIFNSYKTYSPNIFE